MHVRRFIERFSRALNADNLLTPSHFAAYLIYRNFPLRLDASEKCLSYTLCCCPLLSPIFIVLFLFHLLHYFIFSESSVRMYCDREKTILEILTDAFLPH
jgi:hypothetical protein